MKLSGDLFGSVSVLGLALVASSALAGCPHDVGDVGDVGDEPAPADGSAALHTAGRGPIDEVPIEVNRGLTWVKARHDNVRGQDTVSCHDYTSPPPSQSTTPTRSCNPYVGDTDCRLLRPVLCIRRDGSTSNGFVGSFYNGWAKGNIGLTHPIAGNTLTSPAVADGFCVAEFGAGWEMGQHHHFDGPGGWQWTAYGNLNDLYADQKPGHTLDHRFWVRIDPTLQPGNPMPGDPTENPNGGDSGKDSGKVGVSTAVTSGNCWD